MLRQASSRNQRSKGFKIKHGLQICLLIAVCIWLLYQVKHSYDKKRALLRSNSLKNNIDKKDDFFKFGRKDLPQIEETHKVTVNDGTQEDETEEEDQDTKQDENVNEVEIDEDKDAKDDDIDEQDREKGDEEEEPEQLDDIDEQDREKGNEEEEPEHLVESAEEEDKDNNNESNTEEEKDEHSEVDIFDNSQEHEGSTQEAREENYKRDDASSAVVHDARVAESETGAIAEKTVEEEARVNENDYDSDGRGVNGTGSDTNTESLANKVLELETVTNRTNAGTEMNAFQEKSEEKSNIGTSTNVHLNETVQTNSTNAEGQNNTTTSGDIANVDSTQNLHVSNNSTASDEHATKIDVPTNKTTVESRGIIAQNNSLVNNSTMVEKKHESENKVNLDENGNPTLKNASSRDEIQETSEYAAHDDGSMEERDDRLDMSTLPQVQNEVLTSYDEANE